jgi:uncharacterized membrane protein
VSWVVFGVVLALVIVTLAFVFQLGANRKSLKFFTYGLRLVALVAVLLVLMEPLLRREETIPQQSFLVHLFDTSGSMAIEDYAAAPRMMALQSTAMEGETRQELDRLFKPLDFSFDATLSLHKDSEPLAASDSPTDMTSAFRSLQAQISGLPVSGIVLCTDGNPSINNNLQAVVEAASRLEAPLYCVGAAPETPGPDIWVEKIIHPDEALKGVGTKVSVLVGAREMKSQRILVTLRHDGREVESKKLYPARDDQVLNADFVVLANELGPASYNVQIETIGNESYPWNNEQDFFMNVIQKKHRILYVEGYPRYEYRFLRAAFEKDDRFQVTSMISVTDKGHLYRQGLENDKELEKGFPSEKEELFKFDVVVIGDVPASNFKKNQLNALREFVSEKGGGLLFLAGENSFARNGFAQTALADVLPFTLAQSRQLDEKFFVEPTEEGMERTLFGPYDPARDMETPWAILPALTGLFSLGELKPGAMPLCVIRRGHLKNRPTVVAYQRFGRGTTIACGISNTWPWKFQTPSVNPSYAAFWKEMMLILFERASNRVQVRATPSIVPLGSELALKTTVLDNNFRPDSTAQVELTIEPPEGEIIRVKPQVTLNTINALYQHKLTPSQAGIYTVTARTENPGEEPREHQTMFIVKTEPPELKDIDLNKTLLRHLAGETGGDYVHLSEYEKLPNIIRPLEGSLSKVTTRSIWDRPTILNIILGLILVEWLFRRLGNMA